MYQRGHLNMLSIQISFTFVKPKPAPKPAPDPQALFVLLLLPFLSGIKGIPFAQLPAYLKAGTACFFNAGDSVGKLSFSR
jgi:hypothetical protein